MLLIRFRISASGSNPLICSINDNRHGNANLARTSAQSTS
jgi:hypothetical protein